MGKRVLLDSLLFLEDYFYPIVGSVSGIMNKKNKRGYT